MTRHVLAINGGSSTIKFAMFAAGPAPVRVLSGSVERIGLPDSILKLASEGRQPVREPVDAADHGQAAARVIDELDRRIGLGSVTGVGHRVVHGGSRYTDPHWITPELITELQRLSPIDPAHLPGEIALIEAFRHRLPAVPQLACFDTAFHGSMPLVAKMLPLPRRYWTSGIRRYGFHGLSYAYLMEELARVAGAEAARGRVLLAHLGSGASMAAVRDGRCLDTTMAFTPTAGLVMATRSGDLDPGLLVYLLRNEGLTADGVDDLVNRKSGLVGVSETSPDMRDLLARRAGDPRAAEAVALFCYQAKKWIGALAAALGGLDTLVFAAGIGEHAPEVRAEICDGLEYLGIRLDPARNAANAPVISIDARPTRVRVIPTDEEAYLARSVLRMLETPAAPA